MSSPFKAYDIRGRFPDPLSPELARALGHAIAKFFGPKKCVVGLDARLSGPALRQEIANALESSGIHLTNLGQCGTEEIYNAAANGDFDLGIMITGSHNPADENGFKLVRRGAVPVGRDSGLADLEKITAQILAENNDLSAGEPPAPGADAATQESMNLAAKLRGDYLEWLVDYSGVNEGCGRKLRVVADAGNGCAGLLLEPLSKMIGHELIAVDWRPNGAFPNGVPNPLLPGNRSRTSAAVLASGANLGVAFDGDFDRCFFTTSQAISLKAITLWACSHLCF